MNMLLLALPILQESKEAGHLASAAKPLEEPKSVVQCVLEATGCQVWSLLVWLHGRGPGLIGVTYLLSLLSCVQNIDLAEQCLKETAGDISLAIVELLQLMALTECDCKYILHPMAS